MNDTPDTSQKGSAQNPQENSAMPKASVSPNTTPSPANRPHSDRPEYFPHGKYSMLRTARGLFFSHLGGVLVSILICFSLSMIMVGAGIWLGAPLVLLVYGGIIYGSVWGLGHEDANLAQFKHITLDPWRGLKLGLIVASPFIAFGLFFIVCRLINVDWFNTLAVVYRLVNAEVWPLINAVAPAVVQAAEGEVAPPVVWSVGGAIAAGLFPILPIFFAQLGYHLGTKDYSIMQRLVYKNKKPAKKKEPKPPKSQYTPSR